ncbi:MAG: ROK family protein [Gammaproteobacteria bacterium]
MGPRIGVDLGGTKILGIVLEADDSISKRVRVATPQGDYAATLSAIAAVVEALDGKGALPVGIGTPGAWIAGRGVMQNCNSTWLNGRPLLTDLQERLGLRVRLANDADCFALSEAVSGSAAGRGIVVGVILGTGVGGGIVVDGRLLKGPNGLTGEWGHTPIAGSDGTFAARPCYCGRSDCVETYLSGPGLLATHLERFPEEPEPPVDAAEIYRRAELSAAADWMRKHEEASLQARARTTLGVYCRLLACNLAQIVNVIDPDAIVLGGGLSQMSELYSPVRALMADHVFGEVFETVLLPPRWGDASGVRGAAWLWD